MQCHAKIPPAARAVETFPEQAQTMHRSFIVPHPTTGASFEPAREKIRQPAKRVVFLHDTASFFSAYRVESGLISKLEALLVRVFCNTLTNKKMEKL